MTAERLLGTAQADVAAGVADAAMIELVPTAAKQLPILRPAAPQIGSAGRPQAGFHALSDDRDRRA